MSWLVLSVAHSRCIKLPPPNATEASVPIGESFRNRKGTTHWVWHYVQRSPSAAIRFYNLIRLRRWSIGGRLARKTSYACWRRHVVWLRKTLTFRCPPMPKNKRFDKMCNILTLFRVSHSNVLCAATSIVFVCVCDTHTNVWQHIALITIMTAHNNNLGRDVGGWRNWMGTDFRKTG